MTQTPLELSERQLALAEESSRLGDELTGILEKKPAVWMAMRTERASDSSTDKAWDATPEGIREMGLRLKLKGNEKLASAIKTHLRVLSDQAHGVY